MAEQEAVLARVRAVRDASLTEYVRSRKSFEDVQSDVRHASAPLRADPLTIDDARSALPPGSCFIAFSVGDERTTILMAAGSGSVALRSEVMLVSSAELTRRITTFIEILQSKPVRRTTARTAERRAREMGAELFNLLFPESIRPDILRADR